MVMALDRREQLALDLPHLSPDRLADAALAVGLDLGAGRRFQVLAQLLDLRTGQLQLHDPRGDLGDLLRRDVARLTERTRRDREPIEDVFGRIAGDLVDLADLVPAGSE